MKNRLTIELPRLHAGQLEIARSTARYCTVACGRRWGKSYFGGWKATKSALEGQQIWWIAPTHHEAGVGWSILTHLAGQIPSVEIRRGLRQIVYPGGGSVTTRTASDPQRLRGHGPDGVIFDECAFIDEDAWVQVIRPALSDRQGWALFLSTPRGYNWFHELYKRGEAGEEDWASWRRPTRTNPNIPAAEIEAARHDMPESYFRQEYEAEFISGTGGLFDVNKLVRVPQPPEIVRSARFYDLAVTAKATADFTASVKLGLTADNQIVILDVWRAQKELPDVHEAIVQIAAQDGERVPIRLEAEKAGIVQLQFLLRDPRMGRYAIDALPPVGDKYTRAAPFAARANAGRVLMVDAPWNRALIDEMAMFPNGRHDDQIDALSGAYAMLTNVSTGRVLALDVAW